MTVVVYRTGNPDNFRWTASLPLHSKKIARRLCERLEKLGCSAFLESEKRFRLLGPPRTYKAALRKELPSVSTGPL